MKVEDIILVILNGSEEAIALTRTGFVSVTLSEDADGDWFVQCENGTHYVSFDLND